MCCLQNIQYDVLLVDMNTSFSRGSIENRCFPMVKIRNEITIQYTVNCCVLYIMCKIYNINVL